MASLTDTLSMPSGGKQITPTAVEQSGSGFINSLLSTGSSVLSAIETGTEQARVKNGRKALADAAQRVVAEAEAVQGQGRQVELDYQAVAGVGTDEDIVTRQWTQDADGAIREITKTQKAVKQGKLPAVSMTLSLERIQKDLLHKYPEYSREIVDYLGSTPFTSSYVFRDIKNSMNLDEARTAAQTAGIQNTIKDAYDAGIVPPDSDPQLAYELGRQYNANQAQLAAIKADTAAKVADTEFQWKVADRQKKETSEQMVPYLANNYGLRALGAVKTIQAAFVAANQLGPEATAEVQKRLVPARQYFEAMRSQAVGELQAMGGKDAHDAIKDVEERFDMHWKGIEALANTGIEANKRILDTLKTSWGVKDAEATYVIGKYKDVLGQAGFNAMFENGQLNLSPEQNAEIKSAVQGLSSASADEGRKIIFRIEAIRNGQKIKDVPEADAIKTIPALVAMANEGAKLVSKDTTNEGVVQDYLNTQTAIIDSSLSLQPGNQEANASSALLAAASAVGGQQHRLALKKLSADPRFEEDAQSLALGSRLGAQQILIVGGSTGMSNPSRPFQTIKFDPKTQKYFTYTDPKGYEAWAKTQSKGAITYTSGVGTRGVPTLQQAARDIPPEMTKRVDAMNLAMTHLLQTRDYDETIPKGVTSIDLGKHYAWGKPLTDAAGKPVKSAQDQQTEVLNNLDEALTGATLEAINAPVGEQRVPASFRGASISAGDAVSRFESYGVPKHIAAGIVGNLIAESGLNTGAVSTTTKGRKDMSLAQWEPKRREAAAAAGYDLNDPIDAIDFVLHELKTTEPRAYTELKKAKTSEEAARIFALYFLRPKGAETGNADNIHNIAGRVANAKKLG